MKHDTHLTIKGRNPDGGVMVEGKSLITYEGEIIFKECSTQEYESFKKLGIGCAIEVEEYSGVKLKITKEPVIYSNDSIGFNVYAEEIK